MGTNARTLTDQVISNQGTPPRAPEFDTVLHQAHVYPIVQAVLELAMVRPALSIGAEAADVIAATIQLTDLDGNNLAEAREVELALYDDNGLESLVGAFTLGATTGTEVTTTAKPRLFVTSTAAGLIVVDITDVVGGSGSTIHLVARVASDANKVGGSERITVTFD